MDQYNTFLGKMRCVGFWRVDLLGCIIERTREAWMIPITSCPRSARELGCVVGVFESSGYGSIWHFPHSGR